MVVVRPTNVHVTCGSTDAARFQAELYVCYLSA